MNRDSEYFLNVQKSVRGLAWKERAIDPRKAALIAQSFGLPEIVARLLAARDVEADDVPGWLEPKLRDLIPPANQVRDLEKAAARLASAIADGQTVAVIGDYDVDGISSSTLLTEFLDHCRTPFELYIPDRQTDGYGPNIPAVEALHAKGARVLVTLDCGTMSHTPLARATELGLDAIVADHHQVSEELPVTYALINPNRHDDLSGLGHICAAGVTFLLIAATNKALADKGWWQGQGIDPPDLLKALDLVALATVCDVVPLIGLNRAFVRQGLKVMATRNRTGLVALADTARLTRAPDAYALGFVLGPRINAAGRIGSARDAVKLLRAQNRGEANALAAHFEDLNKKRQALELAVVDKARREAEAGMGKDGEVGAIVVSGLNWHPGVLGLAAGRLKESYDLPSFVLGIDAETGEASGSGRSITGVDLGKAVQEAVARGIVTKGGGHAMAAGLSLPADRIGDLRAFLEAELASDIRAAHANRSLSLEGAVGAGGASVELIEQINKIGPFGAGNAAPRFVLPSHRIVYADIVGTDHVRCTLQAQSGARIKAIAFRVADTDLGELLLTERDHPLHFAGRLTINEWGGRREPQLMIEDVAKPQQ